MVKARAKKRSKGKAAKSKRAKTLKSKKVKARRGKTSRGHTEKVSKHKFHRGRTGGRRGKRLVTARGRRYRFVDAPPKAVMKKRAPESAPRLFEWLVDNGYVESVSSYRSGSRR